MQRDLPVPAGPESMTSSSRQLNSFETAPRASNSTNSPSLPTSPSGPMSSLASAYSLSESCRVSAMTAPFAATQGMNQHEQVYGELDRLEHREADDERHHSGNIASGAWMLRGMPYMVGRYPSIRDVLVDQSVLLDETPSVVMAFSM